MTHTPGPWTIMAMDADIGCRTILGGRSYFAITETVGLSDDDEDRANAHLIAAAPELLEALEAIAEGRTLVMDDIGETFAEALRRDARAAIEKAGN